MSKTAVITARVDEEVLQLVDQVAKAQGRSRAWFVSQAVERAANAEAEYLAFVQEGIDAIEKGDVVPHDEVMAELDRMIAKYKSKCEE